MKACCVFLFIVQWYQEKKKNTSLKVQVGSIEGKKRYTIASEKDKKERKHFAKKV